MLKRLFGNVSQEIDATSVMLDFLGPASKDTHGNNRYGLRGRMV